jgi:cytochrome c biogenesis protein CcmG/thiol:disulfide interchange protein DsbE
MRAFLITPLIIFLIMLMVMIAKLLDTEGSKNTSTLIGKALPAFNLPAAIDSTPGLANTDISGTYSILNVFASWCLPCKVEHPFLMKLTARGIPIYGIAWRDKPENLGALLKEAGNPYKRIGSDKDGKTIIDLGVTGAPETFVVSPDGIILYRYPGILTEEIWTLKILPIIEGK